MRTAELASLRLSLMHREQPHMRHISALGFNMRGILSAFALAAILSVHFTPSHAQISGQTRQANRYVVGQTSTIVTSTAATTAFVDVLSLAFTPNVDPNASSYKGYLGGATYGVPADVMYITWSVDVTKATSTTATCGVYANGALITASERAIGYAGGEGVVGGTWRVANTTTGAQTVKIQCNSGDTATATFNRASMLLEEHY